jgi:Tol biopolymer transport system component/DNA-binding winged helix-turn-helix (wHTH) protein
MDARTQLAFGDFHLDCASGELRRNGARIKLQPQPAKLLTLLATRKGEVVTRGEILRALWGNDTFVDFEHGINFCIKQIRDALGDKVEDPKYVETVPRVGYRFVARVEALPADAGEVRSPYPQLGADSVETKLENEGARGPSRLARIFGAAAILGGMVWILHDFSRTVNNGAENENLEPRFTQLTSEAGDELFPSFSPSGDLLVYSKSTSGQRDIYLHRVGGANAINLTPDSPFDDIQPAFSPGGDRIAFRSEREGGGLFVMGSTGESVRRVTDHGFNPSWSPDGKRIVFSTDSTTLTTINPGVGRLEIVDVDSSEVRVLDSAGTAYQPQWSPRGHRIVFWSNKRSGRWRDIWTVSPETGDVRPVTHDAATDWNPVWSPDGKHIYFTSAREGTTSLWRTPVDEKTGATSGRAEFVATSVPADVAHLTLSGDGTRIAYAALQSASNLRQVAFDPEAGAVVGDPVWITRTSKDKLWPAASPDGGWIAFSLQGAGSTMNIALVRPDGTRLRMLTTDLRERSMMPSWSPDGSRIAFYSSKNSQRMELWTVRADGSGLQQLTKSESGIFNPVWSPDGSSIAVRGGHADNYVFDLSASSEQRLRRWSRCAHLSGRLEPTSWSRDGHWLAGTYYDPDQTSSAYPVLKVALLAPLSEECRVLTEGAFPRWLPDGRRLLFQKADGLYLLDSDSGRYRRILPVSPSFTLIDTGIDLSRDGRAIYYTERTIDSDIWMLTLKQVP